MKFHFFIFILMTTLSSAGQAQADARLDSLFQEYFKAGEPGAAVLIAREGEVIYKNGFGIADIHSGVRITPETLFNTGSISKTFVAYGILKLVEEGKLNLEDDLYTFFPDFISPAIARRVKIYHLLTHSSGLPDSRKVEEEREFYLTAKDEENWAPLKSTTHLQFDPGTRYRYSNPAFNGLALIIEKITGRKWQEYIAESIFKPLGMLQSTITDGPHPQSGVAHAYIRKPGGAFEELDYGEEPTFAAAGNGGVWSSVTELWRYEQGIQNNAFLSPQMTGLSRSRYPLPGWQDSLPSRLGLSWFIGNEGGKVMIGHTGTQGGFIGDYCWWPQTRIFYVLLCNSPQPIREIREKVMKWVDPGGP